MRTNGRHTRAVCEPGPARMDKLICVSCLTGRDAPPGRVHVTSNAVTTGDGQRARRSAHTCERQAAARATDPRKARQQQSFRVLQERSIVPRFATRETDKIFAGYLSDIITFTTSSSRYSLPVTGLPDRLVTRWRKRRSVYPFWPTPTLSLRRLATNRARPGATVLY